MIPSVYRVYSLAVIYRLDVHELLSWYGIDLQEIAKDISVSEPPRTHRIEAVAKSVKVPTKIDPSFDLRKTTNFGRMIEQWGVVPFAELQKLSFDDFTDGYVGTDDFTMFPLLPVCLFRSTRRRTRSWKAFGAPRRAPYLLRGNARRIYLFLGQH